ncbi:AtpZ/AtpI family protein [Acidipila sp. EB88]|uniref:AtpZ/AtpI family protein n=1 Tax=Acidipila sp. EB88 TaxID=2305226 RepID=UPI000F5FB2A8|nr:AtpZ/AtpI family protein [Acidipila sp. EB88]RRA49659.1 AtpZ/AtpI family protein [Acidipila sp. EB88]
MPSSSSQPDPPRRQSGSMQALVKAEKLSQVAFALPVSVLVGWLLGAGLDKLLHQHWIYIAGLLLGVVAGFIQVFRMINEPGLLSATAYDKSAPRGQGFSDKEGKDDWKQDA